MKWKCESVCVSHCWIKPGCLWHMQMEETLWEAHNRARGKIIFVWKRELD